MREHPVDRSVLDLRNNGGGEAGGYRDLLRFLGVPESTGPDGSRALIGRLTFSAGASLAVLLERRAPNAVVRRRGLRRRPELLGGPGRSRLPELRAPRLIASRYFGIGGPERHANDHGTRHRGGVHVIGLLLGTRSRPRAALSGADTQDR